MAKSKRSSASNIDIEKCDPGAQQKVSRTHSRAGRVHVPKKSCKDHFSVIEPQINAEGVHVWPFDVPCPVDVLFLIENGRHSVRMNRHGYFEVLYLCSGSANCHIQDRLLPFREGRSRHCGQHPLSPRGVSVCDPVDDCCALLRARPDSLRGRTRER